MSNDELYKMLEDQRRKLGLSQAAVEKRAFGKETNAAFQAIRRGAAPSYDRLLALTRALELDFHIGPRKRAVPLRFEVSSDFVRIPRFDVQLAAGAGTVNVDDIPVSHLAVHIDRLIGMGVEPDMAVIVSVRGDSMAPTLEDGDLVMINRASKNIRDMRLYAFASPSGDARVKRLQRANGQLLIHSDNRRYPTEVLAPDEANEVTMIGQVVWSGHEFER